MRTSPNLGKNKCFTYFLGPEFDFKLESGVKIELNPAETGQNLDFWLKMASNTIKTA